MGWSRFGLATNDRAPGDGIPTVTDRQIGFKGKGAGKVTRKPKIVPPVRP